MQKVIILLFYLAFLTIGQQAQAFNSGQGDTLTFNINDTFAFRGDEVVLEVYTSNFDSIAGLQFSYQFDPNLLEFVRIEDVQSALGLGAQNFGLNLSSRGQILFSFFNAINGGSELPDGSLIFSIRLKVIGEPGALCPVNIGGIPIIVQAINGDNEEVPVCLQNATLDIIDLNEFEIFHRSCIRTQSDTNGSISFEPYGGTGPYTIQYNHIDTPSFSGTSSIL